MPAKLPKVSKQRIEKHTGRELARLMFAQQQAEEKKVRATRQDTLMKEALNNIKDQCYKHCVHCGKFVQLDAKNHREETINGSFFWIGKCTECGKENYLNIFLVKFRGQMGEIDFAVDSKLYTEDQVYRRTKSPE